MQKDSWFLLISFITTRFQVLSSIHDHNKPVANIVSSSKQDVSKKTKNINFYLKYVTICITKENHSYNNSQQFFAFWIFWKRIFKKHKIINKIKSNHFIKNFKNSRKISVKKWKWKKSKWCNLKKHYAIKPKLSQIFSPLRPFRIVVIKNW